MKLMYVELYFLWFVLYSIAGWIYETIICSIEAKKFINRGFLNGPYCPIYGCGAVLDILVLGHVHNAVLLFLLGLLLNCTLEYITSFVMEKVFNARWWDYSEYKFNLNGRVCLLGAVVFGAFAVVMIKFIHPFVKTYTDMLSEVSLHILVAVLLVVLLVDAFITVKNVENFENKLCVLTEEMLEEKSRLIESDKNSGFSDKIRESVLYKRMQPIISSCLEKLNRQEVRFIKSFSIRSQKYNDALGGIRYWFWKKNKDDSN